MLESRVETQVIIRLAGMSAYDSPELYLGFYLKNSFMFLRKITNRTQMNQLKELMRLCVMEDENAGYLLLEEKEYVSLFQGTEGELFLSLAPYYLFYLEGNEEPIGYVRISAYMKNRARIQHVFVLGPVYVTPVMRGLGYAKTGLTILINTLKNRNISAERLNILVTVHEYNAGAYSLYKSLGFQLIGTEESHTFFRGKYFSAHHLQKIVYTDDQL